MKPLRRLVIEFAPWIFIAWVAGVQIHHWIEDVMPASLWFDMRSVTVSNSNVGAPVVIDVDREIHHPFRAKWVATVRWMTDRGMEKVCSAAGENDYRVGSVLPTPTTLDWWLGGYRCALDAGRYRLDTVWVLDVTGYPPKAVSTQSNVFEVRP